MEQWPSLKTVQFAPEPAQGTEEFLEVMEEIEEGLELDLPFFLSRNKARLEEAGATLPDTGELTRVWKTLRERVAEAPPSEQGVRLSELDRRFMDVLSGMVNAMKGQVETMPVQALPADLRESYYRGGEGKEEMFALHIFPKETSQTRPLWTNSSSIPERLTKM